MCRTLTSVHLRDRADRALGNGPISRAARATEGLSILPFVNNCPLFQVQVLGVRELRSSSQSWYGGACSSHRIHH